MEKENKKVDFTFGWLAMKLLGKSLYSNAWSAISELVANGFDANATEVYIFIDIQNKDKSIIEIFDNGRGMSTDEINTYVKVGYNKRENEEVKKRKPMGRKGIGKLAALYLSEKYYILTKTDKEPLQKWKMSYVETNNDPDSRPSLESVTDDIPLTCVEQWKKLNTGTFLKLTHVNLSGKGTIAFQALEQKLSNYFSLNTVDKKIKLCVYRGGEIEFKNITKHIAFGNMAFIEYNKSGMMSLLDKHSTLLNKSLKIPFTKKVLGGADNYEHKIDMSPFKEEIEYPIQDYYEYEIEDTKEKKKIKYSLNGWIGIHSSINKSIAKENDENFEKSNSYNPNQLRLYVRNKLAIENFLNIIDNTQAFVNYIEGELSFDILDDDNLPDIATSNRQSMDEHDDRIQLLKSIVTPIIQDLIKKRTNLANKIKISQDKKQEILETTAKAEFTKEVEEEVENLGEGISSAKKAEFTKILTNKIKGDILKHDYVVFLSHASANNKFTNFLYNLLLYHGADKSEFFYTSKDDEKDDLANKIALSEQIKDSIINSNTLLFFLTSEAYQDSQFCMFEGGAGWATRGIGEYVLWSLDYDYIPKFLTNGKKEMILTESLNKDSYINIIFTLNKIIEHINTGRKIKSKDLLELFPEITFPDQVKLDSERKTIQDYMNDDIKTYWDSYIKLRKIKNLF